MGSNQTIETNQQMEQNNPFHSTISPFSFNNDSCKSSSYPQPIKYNIQKKEKEQLPHTFPKATCDEDMKKIEEKLNKYFIIGYNSVVVFKQIPCKLGFRIYIKASSSSLILDYFLIFLSQKLKWLEEVQILGKITFSKKTEQCYGCLGKSLLALNSLKKIIIPNLNQDLFLFLVGLDKVILSVEEIHLKNMTNVKNFKYLKMIFPNFKIFGIYQKCIDKELTDDLFLKWEKEYNIHIFHSLYKLYMDPLEFLLNDSQYFKKMELKKADIIIF